MVGQRHIKMQLGEVNPLGQRCALRSVSGNDCRLLRLPLNQDVACLFVGMVLAL